MKITTKTLILLLLVIILSFTLISCAKDTGNPPPIGDKPDDTAPIYNINKNQLLRKISQGMVSGEERLSQADTKYVSTVYTIHTGYINYTVTYKANYASKRQNSEIYAKIFDNNYHLNRIFIYYNKGDLFIQSQDEKHSLKDFGMSSMFNLFFETVTMLDMSTNFISQDMSALFDPDNVGQNIGALIDQSRMTYIKVTETAESIETTDVNLNYGQIKQQVNNLIKDTFEKFEDKFDLLSLKYLGLRISELSYLEIATMVGDLINVRLDLGHVETIVFKASGDMADGINTFDVEMEVEAKPGSKDIIIDETENPYLNNYPEMVMGRYNYGGTLYVPFLDMTYDATLRTILSSNDNTINQVVFTLESVKENVGGLYYKDQMLYADISGINDQLNGAIELNKLNLPRVKFDNIDLAQEITLLMNDVLKIVQSLTGEDVYGENEELMRTVLANIVSNEDDNTISITITKELIQNLYGEDVDLVDLISQKLGVAPELIAQIFGDDAWQEARLILIYNVDTGAIGVDLYDGDSLIFELRLEKIDSLPGDTLTYPASFNPDNYYWLEIPDNTILSLQGKLSMQEVSKVQMDQLFGALFGDISGKNTPYTLYSNEALDFYLDIMQVYDYQEDATGEMQRTIDQRMKFELYKKEILQLGVYSSSDPNYLLVNFNVPIGPQGVDRDGIPYTQRTLKYRIEREKVNEAFDEFLGEGNIFCMENVMDVLSRLLQSLNESVSMRLRFVDSSLAFNLISDTVYDLIGIENLNADVKARVRFAMAPEEYLNVNIIENEYVTPNVSFLDNDTSESIYTTQWQEYVYTHFGDNLMRLKLSYIEDSVAIVSGKYFYQPRAKILDQIVSYYVTIEDVVNGIKVVHNVLDPETPQNINAVLNVDRPLSIDPSKDTDLPEKIPVSYDDGTFGYVNYIIEGFDISNINVSGMPKAEYWLVIGKGSVAEKRFYIAVEILGRIIIPLKETIQGEQVYMKSNLGMPVVAEVTIDPYTYAIRKEENSLWTPLKTSLTLNFESIDGVQTGDSIYVSNIDWDFDLNDIKFNGGVFYSHAMYNRLTIALKVNIKSKIVAYLRFVDKINTNLPIDSRPYTEAIGQYTVDVLQTSTYTFPTTSTDTQELRLYFLDGTYRVLGTREHSQDDTSFYNSYLPLNLQWKHSTVNQSSIRLTGTKAPLGEEDKNINTTVIGSQNFTIGEQAISLNVLMPSRAEGTIGNAGTVFAITSYQRTLDGEYDFDNPIREHSAYTNASFYKDQPLGSFFDFNPYNQQPLPDTVYLEVIQGGEYRYQRKGYKVQWVESDVLMAREIIDGTGNVLYTDYLLRNVSTDEEFLLVTGILGDGNVSIEVQMIVRNIEAVFQDITFEGMQPNVTNKTIDPYLDYSLPTHYTLMLKNGNEIFVDNVEWYIVLIPGQEWMFQLNGKSYHWIFDYIEYVDAIAQGQQPSKQLHEILPEGEIEPSGQQLLYYRMVIEKGEIPIDSRYVFSNQGGNYTLKSYIEATDLVIAQEVYLSINVIARNLIVVNNDYTRIDIYNTASSSAAEEFVLDTYILASSNMLDRLDLLYRMNDEYNNTLKILNNIIADIRSSGEGLDYISLYSLAYNQYLTRINPSEASYLDLFYQDRYNQNPLADVNELRYYALQDYMQQKNTLINQLKVGLYFGDNPETSTQQYQLLVYWTNIEEIIMALTSSEGAVLGLSLEGYIGYGQINQQLVRIPFRISRREIVGFNFNKLTGYDTSVMTIDYRYVYISNTNEALSLIENVEQAVILDNVPIEQRSFEVFTRVYNNSSDTDKSIMESVEDSIHNENLEIRYSNIMAEIKRLRQENIRTVLVEMHKPLGLTQLDQSGERIFIAPSDYFYEAFSQVSLTFADGTEGYYAPRYSIGDGATLQQQKNNFDSKLLATDPLVYEVELDPETGNRYAYVDVLMTHLSAGSCEYPVTVRFKAIVDQKGVVGGSPSQSELEPFDENGNPRFLQGYPLPDRITVVYDHSGTVTFGNILNWKLISPLTGFEEGDILSVIPATCINVLNPSIIDFSINLPCGQGEYTYQITFPEKYIGKTKYNAIAEDRNYSQLDINDGVMEIDNIYKIYDPTKPIGFDTSKLPRTINPYNYAFGEVQFDIGMIIDTAYNLTGNNAFDVEWRIVDNWLNGRKIDHNGTLVNVDGQLQIAPVLFATATLFSYYYYDINNLDQPKLLEQQIELYIKIKPMLNPVIEYEGLISYGEDNYISFDPYNDSNNYGGNLSLPKDGLKVYFNNNPADYHIFDARAVLNYYLLMSDTDDVVKSQLYDALIGRRATPNTEKMGYQKSFINQLIQQYAKSMSITTAQASEAILSIAYDSIMGSTNLPLSERARQRAFLSDFSMALLSQNYNVSTLDAWNKLLQNNQELSERRAIIVDYLRAFKDFSQDKVIQDIEILIDGFNAMNSAISNGEKARIINLFYDTLNDVKKALIIDILQSKELFTSDITTALEQINFEGELVTEIEKKAEALNRVMLAISANSRLDILGIYIAEDSSTEYISNQTAKTIEETANALLYRALVMAADSSSELIDLIAASLALTIENWDSSYDSSAVGIWDIHLNSVIERGIYENIISLIELYISCSNNYSVNRLKEIIVNRLLNIYDFDDQEIAKYFDEDGQTIAVQIFAVMIDGILPQLQNWRTNKAKAFVWDNVASQLSNDNILTRIMIGENDEHNTGSLDTRTIRALSYERLKQSRLLPIFQMELIYLESQITDPDPENRKSEIFRQLYQNSLLHEKVMLLEIMMGAAYSIRDTQQLITVVPYTQKGHSIAQIDANTLYLYLFLPDGQRLEIVLDIFSREINQVLIPNGITNVEGSQVTTTEITLPNIYYIDPYNSETFQLPDQAEFVFETGYNLVLDIDEWIFDEEDLFYTRSSDLHKIYYYKVSENSYRGGIYTLRSYLTYGIGATAEKQYFTITVVVLNRTLKEEYISNYHFDNPIAGRTIDIPYFLTEDMFVQTDVYYKNVVPPEYNYSNFGKPVVPQINWNKTALNPNGINDEDINVEGGFSKSVQGYLYYDNNLIINNYNKLWQKVYEEYSTITKPMSWEKLFEVTTGGDRVVKTVFAGVAAEQITYLDNQIFNELYLQAYYEAYENPDLKSIIDNLMIALRTYNFGMYPEESEQWFVLLYKDLETKAKNNTLSSNESSVWTAMYTEYVNIGTQIINQKKAQKWDELLAMQGVLTTQQRNIALNYLDETYLLYRSSMLITTWDSLEKLARQSEATVMAEIMSVLSNIYGSIEQAKIRAWDIFRIDDRVERINGEGAVVNITAESWTFVDLIDGEEIINEIIFNSFTKTTLETSYDAIFEIINNILAGKLDEILEQKILQHYDDFKPEALNFLKDILRNEVLKELNTIAEGSQSNASRWQALYTKRYNEAVSPIDNTRADLYDPEQTEYERDVMVWIRLIEGAGEWLNEMNAIMQLIEDDTDILPSQRYYYAVEEYRQRRIIAYTEELTYAYDETYYEQSLYAWEHVQQNYNDYGATEISVNEILYRVSRLNAWNKLYDISSTNDRTTMNAYVDQGVHIDIRYSRAWFNYYTYIRQINQERTQLMDYLLLYYAGYIRESAQYLGYGKIYIDIMSNPEIVDETAESLNELRASIQQEYPQACEEYIRVEFVQRIKEYKEEIVLGLAEFYFDEMNRNAWYYFYARAEGQGPELVALLDLLMDEICLQSNAWQRLYSAKGVEADNALSQIQNIFDQVASEYIDRQLAAAYQQLQNNNNIISIKDEYDRDEIKTHLWYVLYDEVNDTEETAMNSVLNIIIREGGILGEDAEARSWDRLINKNEISDQTKALMSQMFEVYLNARVFETYRTWHIANSNSYIDFCRQSYKESRIWADIYENADEFIQAQMDSELLLKASQFPDTHIDIVMAHALHEIFSQQEIDSMMQGFEFISLSEIEKIKAEEWDSLYNDANPSRKDQMDSVYAMYDGYPQQKRKAASLDNEYFRDVVLTTSQKDELDDRLQQKKDEQLEKLLNVKAFEYLDYNETNSDVAIIFNYLYARYMAFYQQEPTDTDIFKAQAVELYALQLEKDAINELENLLNNCLQELEDDYSTLTWDRYYSQQVMEDEERAIQMEDILYQSVTSMLDNLKAIATSELYNNLIVDSLEKIIQARESILDTMAKEYIWSEYFGENLDSLQTILNNILLSDDNDLTIKNLAWQSMTAYLSDSQVQEEIDMRQTMVTVRTLVYGENTELPNSELNAIAFDKIVDEYPEIGEVLINDFLNGIKSQAWDELSIYYQNNDVMAALLEEMLSLEMLYHNNVEILSKSICWDRMVAITVYIADTLAGVDPRFSEAELRAFAVDCLLDLLSGTESVVLLNAINNVDISLTSQQLDNLVFDYVYRENNTVMKDILEQAEGNKAIALQAYIDYLNSQAVKDIEELSIALFGTSFENISLSQRLELFEEMHNSRQSQAMKFYTFIVAQENWQNASVDTEYARMNVFWEEQALEEGGDIANIYLGNAYKALDRDSGQIQHQNNVFVGYNYLYKTRQIQIDYLDFYGELDIWSGEEIIDTRNYYNQLVIDPLNPYIPDTVDAYGTITDVTPDVLINGNMYTYIGKVDVSFENRIYEFIYDDTGEEGESITARVSPGLGEDLQNVTTTVYYLDRRPVMYYVNSQNYTNELRDETLRLYPLTVDGLSNNKILTIDPLNESIYNAASQNYTLPSSMVLMFTNAYIVEVISTLFMNQLFTDRMDISNVQWNLLDNEITLEGLSPSGIVIDGYNVGGNDITSTAEMNVDFWQLQLRVIQKTPERVLQVNEQGLGGILLASILGNNLTAQNKIDPYNPMISFPNNVRVEFFGGSDSKLLTNITWSFEEGRGLEFLQEEDVITGKMEESAMYLTAGFKCVSQTIWINFPIQPRHIDTSDGMLLGGTLYLIKGLNIQEQLAKYSSLYYNFADFGQTDEWSEVPLEFSINGMQLIDINRVGRYTLEGRLGPINDLNIIFDVEVIDPKLYALDNSGGINPKVYYDSLAIAVNSYGVRVNGKEDEQGFLPSSFVQFGVTDENQNVIIGYNEFAIINRQWDAANKEAIFTCTYTFVDENGDVDRLSGNINGSKELTFTIVIPLQTYLYTDVDETMQLQVNSGDGTNIMRHQLGSALTMANMPKAIMNKGGEDEFEVSLLWDLSSINVNRAGTYNVYGYYRDYTSSYLTKSKNLVVVIDKLDISDQITTQEQLIQTYTGLNIVITPVLPDVLRDNGSYVQLRLGREVIVEYLTAEKYELGEYGDFRTTPYKDVGDYRVRITINDYNATGQQIFNLKIVPIEIQPEDIVFDYGQGSSVISIQIPNWPGSLEEKDRMYNTQFRLLANQKLGTNVPNRARASAYDILFEAINQDGQTLLNNRYTVLLELNYPNYNEADDTTKANMRIAVKAMVWSEITPTGVNNVNLVPEWPRNTVEKELLLNFAKAELEEQEISYTENFAMAWAYDNLFNKVIEIGMALLADRLDLILATNFPNYGEASEALQSTMLIEAKAMVWQQILSTGFEGVPLVPNWPLTTEQKEQILDAGYMDILNKTYSSDDQIPFIREVKAKAFDTLYLNVYSTAQEKLENDFNSRLQQEYPNFDNYDEETKQLAVIHAKSIAWDSISPNDTVSERSYVYDGLEHMPIISGLPQAKIIGWPQTDDEKASMLEYARTENINFTNDEAKARAYDNLLESVYSNIYALQKITDILNNILQNNYPEYYDSGISYEARQLALILAKARAWDTRILPADTVQEINYSFEYWYANMNNESSIIYSRPKDAGTYEIILIIDPTINKNYQLIGTEPIKTTISIRRASINQTFVSQMVYSGKPIKPTCLGLHDQNGNLPEGVSIEYSFMKNGQVVNAIRDVGEYTFSAVVNGGNNYPSWTVQDQVLNVTPKDLVINVNTVESAYLDSLKPLNSAVTIDGIVGDDVASMFGYIVCQSSVTSKHMVGEYAINFVGFKQTYSSEKIYYLNAALPDDDVMALDPVLFGNYNITVVNGAYRINKANENAIIISSEQELATRYDELGNGSSAIWYLAPGNYGDFVIDKNVGITLIGCYDTAIEDIDTSDLTDAHEIKMREVKYDALSIVTYFNSITINRGALTLDIVRINGKINQSVINIGKNATSIDIRRSAFIHTEIKGEGGESIPQNSSALITSPSFNGTIRVENSFVEGFTTGIYMSGGRKLEVVNCRFNKNRTALRSFDGDVHIEGSRFEFNRDNAVYLQMRDFIIINCSFNSNEIGIKSMSTSTYDLWLENSFSNNVSDIESI